MTESLLLRARESKSRRRSAPNRVNRRHLGREGASAAQLAQRHRLMWRFTRSNGITEGFHNKMETITRQAYGFRNFENYRQRMQVLCS